MVFDAVNPLLFHPGLIFYILSWLPRNTQHLYCHVLAMPVMEVHGCYFLHYAPYAALIVLTANAVLLYLGSIRNLGPVVTVQSYCHCGTTAPTYMTVHSAHAQVQRTTSGLLGELLLLHWTVTKEHRAVALARARSQPLLVVE